MRRGKSVEAQRNSPIQSKLSILCLSPVLWSYYTWETTVNSVKRVVWWKMSQVFVVSNWSKMINTSHMPWIIMWCQKVSLYVFGGMATRLTYGLYMVASPAKVLQLVRAVVCPLTLVGQYWFPRIAPLLCPHSLFASSIIQVFSSIE